MPEHTQVKVSVLAYIVKDNKILFQRRFNTGWEDGKYTVPSGRVDKGELPKEALIRELKEELGIDVKNEDLQFIYSNFIRDKYSIFMFKVNNWQGEPKIMEPDKCDELTWFDLENLPENILGRGKEVLADVLTGVTYREYDAF